MTWFKKDLGDAVMASPALETLKEQHAAMYGTDTENSPQVFVRYDASGGLHCEVTIYFSPAAGLLAKLHHAEPCAAPMLTGISLLAGRG